MDLRLTPDDEAFRRHVRDWLQRALPEDIKARVQRGGRLDGDMLRRWMRILGRRGWLCTGWSADYGGPGWTPCQSHLFQEEMARAAAPRIPPFGPVMLGPVLMAYGTPDQQARFLPGIRSGEDWWAQGYSEPGAGSDLASLRTRAERCGDMYVVQGQKLWTSYAQYADWIFCLVRTDPSAPKQKGISFLLIDMKSAGITVRPVLTLEGEHHVNEVFFDEVRVPAENLVGEENEGWTYAKHLLGNERTNIADVPRLKQELRALKAAVQSSGLWEEPGFRGRLAQLEVDVVALEMMLLRVLSSVQTGKPSLDVAGLLKLRSTELVQRCGELWMLAGGAFSMVTRAGDDLEPASAGLRTLNYLGLRRVTISGGSSEV